jgi:hypothetical protein
LLGTAAEVLTMCCFFGAAWVRPCCIGMIRVGSYFSFRFKTTSHCLRYIGRMSGALCDLDGR